MHMPLVLAAALVTSSCVALASYISNSESKGVAVCNLYEFQIKDIASLKDIHKNIEALQLHIFDVQRNREMLELLARRHTVVPEQEKRRLQSFQKLVESFQNQINLLERRESEVQKRVLGIDVFLDSQPLGFNAKKCRRRDV